MDVEIAKLAKKIEAGADVIFTQPIYEMGTLEEFLRKIEAWKIPVMVGVLPLRGSKHAEFLHNEIPGMNIPEDLRHRFRTTREKPMELGVQIAVEFLRQAKSHVSGVYMMPPFKRARREGHFPPLSRPVESDANLAFCLPADREGARDRNY
jgi:homocysteine S-methyltransferase